MWFPNLHDSGDDEISDDVAEYLSERSKDFRDTVRQRRFGKVFIPRRIHRDMPLVLMGMTDHFLPYDSDHRVARDGVEFIGYSPDFDKTDHHAEPLEYKVMVKQRVVEKDNDDSKDHSIEQEIIHLFNGFDYGSGFCVDRGEGPNSSLA